MTLKNLLTRCTNDMALKKRIKKERELLHTLQLSAHLIRELKQIVYTGNIEKFRGRLMEISDGLEDNYDDLFNQVFNIEIKK